jgi:hypothetical protein
MTPSHYTLLFHMWLLSPAGGQLFDGKGIGHGPDGLGSSVGDLVRQVGLSCV